MECLTVPLDVLIKNKLIDGICFTSNGCISHGCAVMGAGSAKAISDMNHLIKQKVGMLISRNGNITQAVGKRNGIVIFSFPTKLGDVIFDKNQHIPLKGYSFSQGQKVPGWQLQSDLSLIEKSAIELQNLINFYNLTKVALPKPGIGKGELNWNQVEQILDKHLDKRTFCISL